MGKRDRLGWRSDGKIGHVHRRLSHTKNDNIAAFLEYLSALILGRVEDCGYFLDSWDARGNGLDMKAGADGNSVTRPFLGAPYL